MSRIDKKKKEDNKAKKKKKTTRFQLFSINSLAFALNKGEKKGKTENKGNTGKKACPTLAEAGATTLTDFVMTVTNLHCSFCSFSDCS